MTSFVNISEAPASEEFSIFTYGFRPFFLLAGIYAILPVIPWILHLNGSFDPDIQLQKWHAHEMIFGFISAALSGFLLTAVPNWTGAPRVKGRKLMLIVFLWLLGRFVFWLVLFTDNIFVRYCLFLDLLLIFVQGTLTSKAILFSGNKRNFILVAILAMLGIANFFIILELTDISENTASIGTSLAPNIILLLLAVIGGRVTPGFTHSYFQTKGLNIKIRSFKIIEIFSIAILVLNVLIDLVMQHTLTNSIVALTACFVHLVRFSFWKTYKTFNEPIVWVLHFGYIWLILTLFLKGIEGFITLPYNLYIHAFALGAVGTYIIGIMSRASLGHTGRPLVVNKFVTIAYILISIAALVRILAPFAEANFFVVGMILTSIFWVAGFSLYLWVYTPILTSPRIDGKPG